MHQALSMFCALQSRILRSLSGSVHPPDDICRESQALSTFCAFHPRQLRSVSGSLHPHDENCRRAQALSAAPHENSRASQALCTAMMKLPTGSGSEHFCAFHSSKLRGVSGALHPMMKFADSLRLCAAADSHETVERWTPPHSGPTL